VTAQKYYQFKVISFSNPQAEGLKKKNSENKNKCLAVTRAVMWTRKENGPAVFIGTEFARLQSCA